ncbi:MAG: hypothetical protein AAF282_11435 [Cyanobacteria bacterium P01_A01_bin.15]
MKRSVSRFKFQRLSTFSTSRNNRNKGFTLIELFVIVIMVGILGAIAAPGWLAYLNRRQVTATRDDVYQSLLQAQTRAKQRSVTYEVEFQETADGVLQWSVHPKGTAPSSWEEASSGNVEIDTGCAGALDPIGAGDKFEFDFKGNVISVGTLYFASETSAAVGDNDQTIRAVDIATLIGGLRKVNNQCV